MYFNYTYIGFKENFALLFHSICVFALFTCHIIFISILMRLIAPNFNFIVTGEDLCEYSVKFQNTLNYRLTYLGNVMGC